jgi:hypothetical protein
MLGVYGQRPIGRPRNSRAGSCQTAFACLRSPPQLNLTPLLERKHRTPDAVECCDSESRKLRKD